jgi:AraC-like DNA-binding protein
MGRVSGTHRPGVPGIAEVFHARIVDYALPRHCQDTGTVLIVDAGAISYDLDTRHCGASGRTVAVLPPGVIHDGRPADGSPGFCKRNLYLERTSCPPHWSARPSTAPRRPARRPRRRHRRAGRRGPPRADRRSGSPPTWRRPPRAPENALADRLRQLLDAHLTETFTLRAAGAVLDRSVPHLVRSFTRAYGVSPHAYVIGKRIEAARHRLLAGARPADVAADLGSTDQAHLNRHFRRYTSTTTGRYARSHA